MYDASLLSDNTTTPYITYSPYGPNPQYAYAFDVAGKGPGLGLQTCLPPPTPTLSLRPFSFSSSSAQNHRTLTPSLVPAAPKTTEP